MQSQKKLVVGCQEGVRGIVVGSCCLGASMDIHNQVGIVGMVQMASGIVASPLLWSIHIVASHGGSTWALVLTVVETVGTCPAIPRCCAGRAPPLSNALARVPTHEYLLVALHAL